MSQRSPLFGLPIAALALAGPALAQGGPDGRDLSSYVGVVDAMKVINAYPKFIDGRAVLQGMMDEFNATMQREMQQIQQLELDILALEAGTQEHRQKTLELDLAQRRVTGLRTIHQEKMNSELARLNVETYQDVFKAVAAVAEAKGLKLVLRKRAEQPDIPDEFKLSDNDRRSVLYVAPELDITQDVINMLKAAKQGDGR